MIGSAGRIDQRHRRRGLPVTPARLGAGLALALGLMVVPAAAGSASVGQPTFTVYAGDTVCGTTCSTEPSSLAVAFPLFVENVTVTFAGDAGLPANVPEPGPVTLSDSNACGFLTNTCSWNWPGSLDLNGTYTIAASGYSSYTLAVAVAPAAPTGVTATVGAGGVVTVGWQLGPEPDLAGYIVSRGATGVETCYLDGGGPAGAPACGAPPRVTDTPGPGTWTYSVQALRYGGPSGLLFSASATSAAPVTIAKRPPPTSTTTVPGGSGTTTTTVPGSGTTTTVPGGSGTTTTTVPGRSGTTTTTTRPGTTTTTTTTVLGGGGSTTVGPGDGLPLPPIDVIGPTQSIVAASPLPNAVASPPTTAPAFSESLPYGSNGKPSDAASQTVESGPVATTNLDGVGLVAGALLALVIAAQFWYVRQAARRLGRSDSSVPK